MYQWMRDGIEISGEKSWFIDASTSGSYTVSITLGPNSVVSDPVLVGVNSSPVAQIQIPVSATIPTGGTLTLAATTGFGLQYQWYLNGNVILGATNSTYDAPYFGAYTVELFNGTCYAVSDPLVLTGGIAGVSEINNSGLVISPNPATEIIELKSEMLKDITSLSIHDMNGTQILNQHLMGNMTQTVSITQFKEGTYLLSLISDNGEVTLRKRFVIIR